MSQDKVYLVAGRRTPFGKFGGTLKDITPVDLSVIATNKLLNDLNLSPEKIDQVLLGNVVPSSTDTMYGARHLALKIKARQTTPGVVVNRLCGSGIEVLLMASRLIRLNEADAIIAAGVENMSMVPHLTYGARFGTKYGSLKNVDMLLDALTDQNCQTSMGMTAENLAAKYGITKAEADQYSFDSHRKAAAAINANLLLEELAEVVVKKNICKQDEHVRMDATLHEMQGLKPTFKENGVVTAGSASGIVDGAASILVASAKFVKENNLKPIAEIVDGHVVGVDPTIMGIGPVPAIQNLLARNKMAIGEIDLFEINEAFSAQTLACAKELKLPMEKLNIWGGAIAYGHPLGASGVRIANTLARQLIKNKLKWGIASACIGGGQGIAILLKSVGND